MIKENEVRIGCIINEGIIYGIKFTNSWYLELGGNWIDIENCNPIPLTEEWLVKFDIKKDNNNDFYFRRFHIIGNQDVWTKKRTHYSVTTVDYIRNNKPHSNEKIFICDLYFVHQLQNCYFTLMGKELTIKA